jgi:integrase
MEKRKNFSPAKIAYLEKKRLLYIEKKKTIAVDAGKKELGYSADVIKHCRTFLLSIFELAVDKEFVRLNPAKRLELPANIKAKDKSFLDESAMKNFLTFLEKLPPRDRMLLKVAIAGNLRPSELFGLNREDLVGDELHIARSVVAGAHVQEGKTKTGEKDTKRVALPAQLVKELQAYIEKDLATPKILFPNRDGGRLDKNNFSRRVMVPLSIAFGRKVDLRMIRRSAATLQAGHGSVKDLQGQLRHSSPTTSMAEYAQVMPKSQKRMVESYWGSLTGVPTGAPKAGARRSRKPKPSLKRARQSQAK